MWLKLLQIIHEIKKIPPITRTISISIIIINLVSLFNISLLGFNNRYILQLWRLYTSFFILSRTFNSLIDFILLFRTSNDLESKESVRDVNVNYLWKLLLNGSIILLLNYPLNTFSLFKSFYISIIYLQSLESSSFTNVSLFGLISMPIKVYPFVLLAIELLLNGHISFLISLTGLLATHIQHILILSNFRYVRDPPKILQDYFLNRSSKQVKTSYGNIFRPTNTNTSDGKGNHNWGKGRKLGD